MLSHPFGQNDRRVSADSPIAAPAQERVDTCPVAFAVHRRVARYSQVVHNGRLHVCGCGVSCRSNLYTDGWWSVSVHPVARDCTGKPFATRHDGFHVSRALSKSDALVRNCGGLRILVSSWWRTPVRCGGETVSTCPARFVLRPFQSATGSPLSSTVAT